MTKLDRDCKMYYFSHNGYRLEVEEFKNTYTAWLCKAGYGVKRSVVKAHTFDMSLDQFLAYILVKHWDKSVADYEAMFEGAEVYDNETGNKVEVVNMCGGRYLLSDCDGEVVKVTDDVKEVVEHLGLWTTATIEGA